MPPSETDFDADRLRQAVATVRHGASPHEGLYEALTDNLQWLETLQQLARAAEPPLAGLLGLISEPALLSVDDRMLLAVRRLSVSQVEQIVAELERLADAA